MRTTHECFWENVTLSAVNTQRTGVFGSFMPICDNVINTIIIVNNSKAFFCYEKHISIKKCMLSCTGFVTEGLFQIWRQSLLTGIQVSTVSLPLITSCQHHLCKWIRISFLAQNCSFFCAFNLFSKGQQRDAAEELFSPPELAMNIFHHLSVCVVVKAFKWHIAAEKTWRRTIIRGTGRNDLPWNNLHIRQQTSKCDSFIPLLLS